MQRVRLSSVDRARVKQRTTERVRLSDDELKRERPPEVVMPSEGPPINEIRAQNGRQEMFLSCPADIVIYGGGAGSGKTFGLLLEPLHYIEDQPDYMGVIFRRTTPQIRNPGSLWDQSVLLYGQLPGAVPSKTFLEWEWKNGGKLKFAHLEYDESAIDWHGAQVGFLGFDELTQFTQFQFFYLISRNRSMGKVRPYIRATCNADSESWVKKFIAWWLDPKTGFPIEERGGKVRWMMRVGDEIKWADRPEDLDPVKLGLPANFPDGRKIPYQPLSVAFIPAKIWDNPILLKTDPGYLAKLLAMPTVERERLLGNNWNIRPAPGLYMNRTWTKLIQWKDVPKNMSWRRGWDFAATDKDKLNDPDFTCGTLIGQDLENNFYVADHVRMQGSPGKVRELLKNTSLMDIARLGLGVEHWIPQDPGAAGKVVVEDYIRMLAGVTVKSSLERGNKVERAGPFSSQAQAGHVFVVEGPWNDLWFGQWEAFPDVAHDDDIDSTSRAFNAFLQGNTGLLDYYRQQAAAMIQSKEEEAKKEIPTLEAGGVKVKGPPNVNMLIDQKGQNLFIGDDGYFVVSQKHAEILKRNGFTLMNGATQ